MPAAADRDLFRLTMILEIAERLRAELDPIARDEFLDSQNQIDLAAYRLGSIGEYVNKLSEELKARHPHIPWRQVYDMRNALFHDYEGVVGALLWAAAGQPLTEIVAVCRAELEVRRA